MNIRLMQESDHVQLIRLWEPENMDTSADYLREVLRRNPTTCFVMEIDGRIVAAACGLYDGRRGVVQSVAVLPKERGKGYGTAIVNTVVEALQELGTRRIRLFVLTENTGAVAFYEHLGFKIHDFVHYMGLR